MSLVALTLRHPWPWAIWICGKRVENRTWPPPRQMVGKTIALHGGKPVTKYEDYEEDEALDDLEWIIKGCNERRLAASPADRAALQAWLDQRGQPDLESSCRPGIFATARLASFFRGDPDPWAARGQWAWRLEDVFFLPVPVQCPGAQKLWTVPDWAAVQVADQYAAAHDGEVAW
jgi:hypothetical protein